MHVFCVEYPLGFLCCHQDTSLNPQESPTKLSRDLVLLSDVQPLHHTQERFSCRGASSYVSSLDYLSKEHWNLCKKSIAQLHIASQLKVVPSPSGVPVQKNKDVSETIPAPPRNRSSKACFKAEVVFTVPVHLLLLLFCFGLVLSTQFSQSNEVISAQANRVSYFQRHHLFPLPPESYILLFRGITSLQRPTQLRCNLCGLNLTLQFLLACG